MGAMAQVYGTAIYETDATNIFQSVGYFWTNNEGELVRCWTPNTQHFEKRTIELI